LRKDFKLSKFEKGIEGLGDNRQEMRGIVLPPEKEHYYIVTSFGKYECNIFGLLESCNGMIEFLDQNRNLDLSSTNIEEEGIEWLVTFVKNGTVKESVSGYKQVRGLLG
jgi:hypothetical protein